MKLKHATLLHAAKADGQAARLTDDASGADTHVHLRRGHGVLVRACMLMALCAALTGCGLAAAPCRIASAGLKIVPVVGHVAAAPTDACADVIDP